MKMPSFSNPHLLTSIVQWCAALLIGLLPFFFLPLSWVAVIQAKVLLVSILVIVATIAWAYARILERSVSLPRSPLAISVKALAVVYAISAIMTGAASTSLVSGFGDLDTLASVTLLAGVFFVAAMAFANAHAASVAMVRAFIAGGAALMLVQLFHLLVPALSLGVFGGRAVSVFGSWHELGIVSVIFVILAVSLRRTVVASDYWKWVLLALGVASMIHILVIDMRDVWVSLTVLMLAYAAYEWWMSRATFSMTRVAMPVAIGIISLICAIGTGAIYTYLPASLQIPQVEVRPSLQGTMVIRQQSTHDVSTFVFGSGPNMFMRQWSLYKPLGVNQTEYWNINFNAGYGFLPTVLITAGFLGLLAWIGVFVALGFAVWRLLTRNSDNAFAHVYVAICASAVYIAVLHILYVPDFTLSALLFFLLGLVASIDGKREPRVVSLMARDWGSIRRNIALSVAVLAILAASFGALRATLSDILVNKSATTYFETNNVSRALAWVKTGLVVYSNNDRAHRAAVELGLIQLSELARATSNQATAELQVSLQTTIQHGLAAVSINSKDYQNWLALANLYQNLAGAGVQGAYENAMSAYSRAIADNPANPLPYLQIAQLEMAQKQYGPALENVAKAITLKPDLAAAYFLRSQINVQRSNFTEAATDALKAAQLSPQEPLGWYNLGAILYSDGRYAQASQALEQALTLQSDYANALFVLGLSYEKQGRHEEALAALRKVAATNPSDASLAQLIKDIEAGQPIAPSLAR